MMSGDNIKLITVILSSSLLASIFTSLMSAAVKVYLKNRDYRDNYFSKVIDKRIEAYELVERQIALLKSSVVSSKGTYHQVFALGQDHFREYQEGLFLALSKGVWLSERTKEPLIQPTFRTPYVG
jgi:hypothetical protein